MPLGIKPTVDFAFKKIFGSPENTASLIGLLNAILDLNAPIEHVTILNPFSYQDFAEDKQIVLDVRARDTIGRWLNVEMQVAVVSGLSKRLVYYACSLYVEQLEAGQDYADLRPAISICLLNSELFHAPNQPHHRFQLVDTASSRKLHDAIEIHTVELMKYNLRESHIRHASRVEQWAFFLLYADQYEPSRLRELLPGVEFDKAIFQLEAIAGKTEDRIMYDQREKAQRDYQWLMKEAVKEAREEGREVGLEQGAMAGRIQLLQQLLGEQESAIQELAALEHTELQERLDSLQQKLRSRGE